MQRQFAYKNATITVHRRRMADRLDSELIIAYLTADIDRDDRARFVHQWNRINSFATMVVSIDAIDGQPEFPIPAPDAPEDELRAGFDAFLNADGGLYDAWLTALNAVNAPLGDADTAPGVDDRPNA